MIVLSIISVYDEVMNALKVAKGNRRNESSLVATDIQQAVRDDTERMTQIARGGR